MFDTKNANQICLQIVLFIMETIYLFTAEHW